jgi:hypothetical protein
MAGPTTPGPVVVGDYPHRVGGHCGSGALRDLLDWAGLGWGDEPPSEGLVFGLGGALAFFHVPLPGVQPPVYLVGRDIDLEQDLCDRLGIATERQQTDDPEQGWQWVVDELDHGRPVMVQADIAHLPYLRVRLANTRHDIVVIGYDPSARTALVVDNDREQVQEISLADLAVARASTGFPDPVRHATWPMRFPERLPDLLPVARRAARASADRMLDGAGPLPDLLSAADDVVLGVGVPGVSGFVEDLQTWPERMDLDQRRQAVMALPVFIDKAGTGGGMFRRLQARFCADVARLTGSPPFAAAAAAYERCAAAWSQLAAVSAAAGDDHAAVVQAAHSLPELEHQAATALARAADA